MIKSVNFRMIVWFSDFAYLSIFFIFLHENNIDITSITD